MIEHSEQQIRTNLKRLVEIHAVTMSLLEDSVAILQDALNTSPLQKYPAAKQARPKSEASGMSVDRNTMSVSYRGRQCFLGNTLLLKLLERLARNPDHYLSYSVLLEDVWAAERDSSTVRSAVKELRAKLRAAGIPEVSEAIDGTVFGHYGLMLSRAK